MEHEYVAEIHAMQSCIQQIAHRSHASMTPDGLCFDFGRLYIGARGAQELAEGLRTDCSVKNLRLCINNIGDEGALCIATALQVNPFNSVQKLSLSYNGISEAGGIALGNALLINRSLKILVLSGNIIKDVGCTAIARALRVNNSLEELELAQETFGTSALGELALALRENRIMRRLRIEYAEEAKQGVFAIAEALRDCPRMHVFTLESYNEIQGWCNTGIMYPQPCLKYGYERLGLPKDASSWSNEEILQYFHELHVESVLAFGMGQNERLGYASLVRYLEDGIIDIVMRAYFGLPL